jgi:hypothetical protein
MDRTTIDKVENLENHNDQHDMHKQGLPVEIKSLIYALISAAFVNSILYFIYMAIQPGVIAMAKPINYNELVEWVWPFMKERDGAEVYFLYVFSLAGLMYSSVLSGQLLSLRTGVWKKAFFGLMLAVSAVFVLKAGFNVPMASDNMWDLISGGAQRHVLTLKIFILVFFLAFLKGLSGTVPGRLRGMTADVLVALILIPVCFIASGKVQFEDYNYVFTPAIKILGGVPLKGTFFQYDALLSLLVAWWLKAGLDMRTFYIAAQLSYYVMILGIYFLAARLFRDKWLAVFLTAVIVVIKIYSNMTDPVGIIQVTPLRLDLWLVLLLLAWTYGPYSPAVGAAAGLMLIFSNAFGTLYCIAYAEFIAFLLLMDILGAKDAKGRVRVFLSHLKLSYKNIAMIVLAYIVYSVIFAKSGPEAAGSYISIGLGFLPVSKISFYWYITIIFCSVLAMLIPMKERLGERYYRTAVFLVFLGTANMVYFLGRSHENNLINTAEVWVLLIFFLIDLISRSLREAGRGKLSAVTAALLASAVLLAAVGSYADMLNFRLNVQENGIMTGSLFKRVKSTQEIPGLMEQLKVIKQITRGSSKVYFALSDNEALYYYYGGYVPPAYFTPTRAWLYVKDARTYIRKLASEGYYICTDFNNYLIKDSLYTDLDYAGNLACVWIDPAKLKKPVKTGQKQH